jgi:hypothetical protein
MIENTQWKWFRRSLLSAAVFSLICVYAFYFIDGMSGGFAVAFVSLFLALSSAGVAALFYYLAKVMDGILKSDKLLARWTYSTTDAEESARREHADYQERNRAMFFVIGGMLVFAAVMMMLFAGDDGVTTGIVLLATAALLFVVSRVVPNMALQKALRSPAMAFIGQNGIIYQGAVYPFRSFGMKVISVEFREKSGEMPAVIAFSFEQLVGLRILSTFDIAIPVPAGEDERAQSIGRALEHDLSLNH